MLTFIKDQDLIYDTEKYDVILVGTSIYCDLKNGFQSKMRYKYPFLQEGNDKTPYADLRKLGTRLTFYDNKPIISLLYIATFSAPASNSFALRLSTVLVEDLYKNCK